MATVLHVAEPDAAISLRIQATPSTCENDHNDSFSYCERQWRYYTTMIHVAPLSTKHSYIDDAYTQVSYVIRWRTQPVQRCQEVHRTNNQVGYQQRCGRSYENWAAELLSRYSNNSTPSIL